MSDPDSPSSEMDFALARRAVERGWVSKEQVESALVSYDRSRGTRLLAHLPLTPGQIQELETLPSRPVPPEAAEAMKDPARKIGRCFWRVNHLKSGGMGRVFRGWDSELHRWVALKFLKEIGDENARAYFRREAQLAAGLDHPNVAKIYEVGEHEGSPFIAMQFVDGETLATAPLNLGEKLDAVRQVAEAVKYAHAKGVIHRDLKPANVMVEGAGVRGQGSEVRGQRSATMTDPSPLTPHPFHVYVMDFGLAREISVSGESLTGTNVIVGTPSYMAPEQTKGKADAQSDVYGIAAILYELATGRPPFTGETSAEILTQIATAEVIWPRKLSPGIPADVEAIILHGLEKERRRRYADVGQLLEDLEAVRHGNPLRHARRPTWAYVLAKRIRKQPLVWGFAVAFVAALLGGGAFGARFMMQRNRALRDKLRTEAEGRRLVEEEQGRTAQERQKAIRMLADTNTVRARQAADAGDFQAALAYDAEACRLAPADVPRLNAQFFLAHVARLVESRNLGAPIYAIAHDDEGRVVALTPKAWPMELEEHPAGLSPDGRHFVTMRKDTMCIRRTKDGSLVGNVGEIDSIVGSLPTFSPDGSKIYCLIRKRVVGSWRVDDASYSGRVAEIGPQSMVTAMCLNGDGSRLYAWVDGALFQVEVGTGAFHRIYQTSDPPLVVHRMSLMPGDRYLAIGVGKAAAFLDLQDQRLMYREVAHYDYVDCWDIAPDGSFWATGSRDGYVRFWTFPACRPTGQVLRVPGGVFALRFSRDGTRLVTGGEAGLLQTWDLRCETFREIGDLSSPKDVIWVPGGKRFLAVERDRGMRLFDVETSAPVGDLVPLGEGNPWVVFSKDRKLAAITAGAVQVVDLETGRRVGKPFSKERASARAFPSDGRLLIVGEGKRAWTWDPKDDRIVDLPAGEYAEVSCGTLEAVRGTVRVREGDRVRAEAAVGTEVRHLWSSDFGNRVMVQLEDGRVRLFALPDLVPVGSDLKPDSEVNVLLFRDGDSKIVGYGDRGALFAWDIARNKKLVPPPLKPEDKLWSGPLLAPDLRCAVVRSEQGGRLWSLVTGEFYGEPIPWKELYSFNRFTEDSRGFVVLTQNSVQIFDTSTGRPRWQAIPLPAYPDTVKFLEKRVVMVACRGEGVLFFDSETGQRIGGLLGHPCGDLGFQTEMEFDPSSSRLLTYHSSMSPKRTAVRVWSLQWLVERSDPTDLQRRARQATGISVNERGEIVVGE